MLASGTRKSVRWRTRLTSATAAFALILVGFVAPATALAADYTNAVISLTKTPSAADATTAAQGTVFNWVLQVACDYTDDACVNATVTDVIPADFDYVGPVSVQGLTAYTASVSAKTVTVQFSQALSTTLGAAVGLKDSATISIPVKLADKDYQSNGQVFTNSATASAVNAPKVSSTGQVTASIPLNLSTAVAKSYDPVSNLALSGQHTTLTVSGTNTSNSLVDTLTVQDPIDPTASPNPFQSPLQVSGTPTATWPLGAATAVFSVYDLSAGAWVDAPEVTAPGTLVPPSSVDPSDIGGMRVVYSSPTPTIAKRALANLTVDVVTTAAASGITSTKTINNNARVTTSYGAQTSPNADKTATYELQPVQAEVSASKKFTDSELATVPYGVVDKTATTATLKASNSGTTSLAELTLNEPVDPADLSATNPFAPAHTGGGLLLTGLGSGDLASGRHCSKDHLLLC